MKIAKPTSTFVPSGYARVLSTVACAIAMIAAGAFYFGHQVSAQDEKFLRASKPVTGKYIVVLNNENADGSKIETASDVSETADALTSTSGGSRSEVYSEALKGFAVTANEAEALMISQDNRVKYVIEDDEMQTSGIQTYATWNLDRIDQRTLPFDRKYVDPLNGAGTDVFIVDTGIQYSNPNFFGRAVPGIDVIGDGRNGWDCNGHGTHVTGIAVGNGYGVANRGFAIGVRVLNCQGYGSASGLIAGIDWIIRNKRRPSVANMSLGFGGINPAVDAAVANLVASGVTTVVAAGNDYGEDAGNYTPARVPSVITVGASDSTDARAYFSNSGASIDIFAPGEDIWSTWISEPGEIQLSGTSMAAPHVAGFVSQVYQLFPNATPAQVDAYIKANATRGVIRDAGANTTSDLLYTFVVNHCGLMKANQALYKGQYVDSCSGSARLIFQTDGNLVLYNRQTNRALWNTRTAGRTDAHAVFMQSDGNFVLYDARYRPIWNSSTARRPGAYLLVQDDNNMVIYNDVGETALWQTRTSGR